MQFESKDVGCLAIEYYPSHIQLTKLYLLPNFQRFGIGTFILRQLISEAKDKEKPL
ncbi:GNAT family N-acetyltransferase [Nostoc sp. TCL240-02]|uniref:GNAT family N-acetyltransferase n=1 Tax=Nostoc sp. TCL240-02 TaxID=2572090 RepID=UPI0034A02107